jgi:hypothetical protein
MAEVTVPSVIGLGRNDAEAALGKVPLRYVQHIVVGAGTGLATAQSPAAGTKVDAYTVVTVSYLSPIFAPDSPVEGPEPTGIFTGHIEGITVDGFGASISLAPDGGGPNVPLSLYADTPDLILPRTDWMRRGAFLGVAERAFSNASHISVTMANGVASAISLIKP